eukprot:TRINITY_DN24929_c0_g1_i1.p1 TRINITY_DN24929_c0_g1~~TRINITY_DN24929_c0_g1_i1.p1  ORF type:complete len:125 (+),score=12.53 TRINITY_DN24929_c0_g1_i1:78-452(+)
MTSPDQIANAFVQHYYGVFDSNRANLASLYRPESMMTFEGDKKQGTTAIMEKINSLPFGKVQHKIDTFDVQPSAGNGVLMFVTGQLITEGEVHPQRFSQVFNLQPIPGTNGFFVLNDLFRLIYG